MKRRGARDQPINLFSFQDIMASVIGVVFFVVLIMALDIVEQKTSGAAVVSETATESEVQTLRVRAKHLRDEITQVEADIQGLADRLNLASGDEQEALDEVKQLEATLKSLYERVKDDQESLTKADAQEGHAQLEHQRKLREIEQLSRRADELRAMLQSVQAAPRLAFIIDAHPDNLEPWLLEISESRLRVASRDGRSAILEFGGNTPEQRQARFFDWLASQNNQTHYFVLLAKPSGVRLLDEIEKGLKAKGIDIGRDLLPEDWEPF